MTLASLTFTACTEGEYEEVIDKVIEEIGKEGYEQYIYENNIGGIVNNEESSGTVMMPNDEQMTTGNFVEEPTFDYDKVINDVTEYEESKQEYGSESGLIKDEQTTQDGFYVEVGEEQTAHGDNSVSGVVGDESDSIIWYEESTTEVRNEQYSSEETTTNQSTTKENTTSTELTEEIVPVTGVSLNKTSITLKEGESEYITIAVYPSTATNKYVLLSSTNTHVATIDAYGKITANGVGTAEIIVITKDGFYEAECKVTVTPAKVIPTNVSLNAGSLQLTKGISKTLTATVSPANATDKSVVWSSSNSSVAKIDSNGKVTAVGNGTATITVKTVDGSKTASCTVTVSTLPSAVSLSKTTASLKKGETLTLSATVSPSDASNKSVVWSSSNTSVATVNSNGKVTAVGNGTATITVKTTAGSKTATCKVTVTTSPTGVSITNKKQLALDVNGTYQCNVSVTPNDASDKSVVWSSSDSSIAKVSSSGKITALKTGVATITVKTSDGSKTDSFKVYVYQTGVQITTGSNIWYRISLASTSNRVMVVNGKNTFNGAKVILKSLDGLNDNGWQFHYYNGANGYKGVVIVPYCNSGAYILDVNRGGNNYTDPFKENNLIDLWSMGSDVQASQWTLVRMYDGSYVFMLYGTSWVAGVTSTSEGAQLMLRKFDPFDQNQKWFLEAMDLGSGDRGITDKLNAAKAKYPNGSSKYTWYNAAGAVVGWQCHGYARWLSEYVWGTDFANGYGKGWSLIKATASNSQIDKLCVGDVVRYRGAGDYNHTIFITSISGNTITYTDCNSDGNCTIYWNRTMDKSTLASKLTKVLSTTNGGESNTYGYIAHYNK